MRISLVLIMVLALATSAHAAISLSLSSTTVVIGSTVTATVSSDNTDSWTGYFILSEDTYYWSDPVAAAYIPPWTIYPNAGDLAQASPLAGYPAVYDLAVGGISVLPSAGTQFSINIMGVQVGTIYIDLQEKYGNPPIIPPGPLTLLVIPEPMTISLLVLGGLMICHSRKNKRN
jgi:hypothetical protein